MNIDEKGETDEEEGRMKKRKRRRSSIELKREFHARAAQ